jgi:hypothetical protein
VGSRWLDDRGDAGRSGRRGSGQVRQRQPRLGTVTSRRGRRSLGCGSVSEKQCNGFYHALQRDGLQRLEVDHPVRDAIDDQRQAPLATERCAVAGSRRANATCVRA